MMMLILLAGCGLSTLDDLVGVSDIADAAESAGSSGGGGGSNGGNGGGVDMDCPEDIEMFSEHVWTPVLGQQCIGCHVEGGVASETAFVLDSDDMLASLRSAAGVADRLVQKPTGQHADGHAGGVLFEPDSSEAGALQLWSDWVGGDCTLPESSSCADEPGERRVWRLTHDEYDRTIMDLLGVDLAAGESFAADVAVDGYRNDAQALTVSSLLADQYRVAAEDIAGATVLNDILPCTAEISGASSCAVEFINDFGRRAFRRPLNQEEVERYAMLWAEVAEEDGFDAGVQWVITAMLQSPHFLYRSELGLLGTDGLWQLTDWEVASELSYLLWGTMPDEALMTAAEIGALRNPAQIRSQVVRMSEDPRAEGRASAFVRSWLQLDLLKTVSREGLSDGLRESLAAETQALVDEVAAGGGTLEDLMLARVTWADESLRDHYGHETTGWIELDDETTGGLLTQGSVLTTYALSSGSSPIHRGVLVRERMLCEDLPPPPADLDTSPPEVDPSLSTRERYSEHSSNPACSSCHNKIDPIGFGFEHYDGLGRYRDVDGVHDVDASGDVDGVEFEGVEDLSALLLDDDRFRSCFVQTWRRWGTGTESCADDPGEVGLTEPLTELTERVSFLYRAEAGAAEEQGSLASGSGLSESELAAIVETLGEIDAGAGGGGTAGVTLDLTTVSEWDSGFCMDAVVSNLSGSTVAWEVRATISGTISGIWNAEYLLDGSDYVFVGVGWNSELGPGETAEFGFCGDR